MKQRVCIYARYSTDLQSKASIEDQFRLCAERAKSENWEIVARYSDAGISGASLMRPGIQSLLTAAMKGEFDILLTEALDRLSRDQEDIAGIFKRMEFAGIKIFTLSEGVITTLHIGLKGTMNALFLKDLADKTRRGLRGRVEKGKSGGGISYGYRVIKEYSSTGEPLKGKREIDESQAAIIRRIFKEYAHENKSPKAIAAQLNREGIPAPSGKAWGQSTINGNRRRGTGILNNELYIGRLIWNRQRFIKDPLTSKRVARLNDESKLVIQDVPDLAIIPQELWEAAKARQKALDKKQPNLWQSNRPRYLLSGLSKCGVCGGGFAKINATHYGCSSSKNKGEAVCDNRRTIKRETLEGHVLQALQTRLMRPEFVDVFCAEYTSHITLLHAQHGQAASQQRNELAALQKERGNLIQAIKDGIEASLIKDDLERVSEQIEKIEKSLTNHKVYPSLPHPAMASRYSRVIRELRQNLSEEGSTGEAAGHMRALIDKVVLTPRADEDGLQIDLYGDLAGIMSVSLDKKDLKTIDDLKRIGLRPGNDNRPPFQDSVGSGGRI